jgi:hypothetical protein
MSRRSRRDARQQRQDDSNRQKHQTRHSHTIDGRLSGGDSNLSAQSSRNCFELVRETPTFRQMRSRERPAAMAAGRSNFSAGLSSPADRAGTGCARRAASSPCRLP